MPSSSTFLVLVAVTTVTAVATTCQCCRSCCYESRISNPGCQNSPRYQFLILLKKLPARPVEITGRRGFSI
ncbi:hypothetical protein [Lysobacter gummosus]|uniref:hypothetical protein n=1 Tax=Lysobacter gummosus TaxID=262324 RepID=UPI0036402253